MTNLSILLDINNYIDIRKNLSGFYAVDETQYMTQLIDDLSSSFPTSTVKQQQKQVTELITKIREQSEGGSGIDYFLQEYSLDTQEGIVLMCLAEALLRIPDSKTADDLIEDKISNANWEKHLKKSDSLFVNASTWGLMLTGKVTRLGRDTKETPASTFGKLVDRLGEPVIRKAMYQAMKIMGKQFVLGRNINEAMNEASSQRKNGFTHSFDMLGEAALTKGDAKRYFDCYLQAIQSIGNKQFDDDRPRPSISIKLSALHPRYEESKRDRVLSELYDSVLTLVREAKSLKVEVTIDAEEMDRLELALDLFVKLYQSDVCQGWGGLGMVVQAYSKRALALLHALNTLAKENKTLIPIRLVKGAYWDTEIKHSQQMGLKDYPVFTRKVNTDISYLACAKYLLTESIGQIYPQFATHNAQTVSSILQLAKHGQSFEFQRLHGMGEELYDTLLKEQKNLACRVYAPVGEHEALLPYLVRRLLENGANTSFVHKLIDPKEPIDKLATHPLIDAQEFDNYRNTAIRQPLDIFSDRKNSAGDNLTIEEERIPFVEALAKFKDKQWQANSIINGQAVLGEKIEVVSPQNHQDKVGEKYLLDGSHVEKMVVDANNAFKKWREYSMSERAEVLNKVADLMEENKLELIAICSREAGKILQDGIDEVREAVDFLRYYAREAVKNWDKPEILPGPTGEKNTLITSGRGVFLCVSPWNFPLAIFTGQISAALVTGNAVIAKPAAQTMIVATYAVQLFQQVLAEKKMPLAVLQLACGKGSVIGQQLIENTKIAGVCFTGSTETARQINCTLAARNAPIVPFIAETGGQNTMIVDSTALPEQVVQDVVHSAFTSAGQRCSALRVLYVQEDIADKIVEVLKGAMNELRMGNPFNYQTDIGPVIDKGAKKSLEAHVTDMAQRHKIIGQLEIPQNEASFVAPTVIEVNSIADIKEENFGPILHVRRFKRANLPAIIDEINSTGYGLTFGIHSRNESFYQWVAERIEAGNIYVNRNQIGAVVGVNPFGGHNDSGTGPKAGGPLYLTRFVQEKTVSDNITAIGGNATLLTLGDATD